MKEIVKAFDGKKVRAVIIKGEPWFVAKDVAEALGYSDTQAMTRRLDQDEVMTDKLSGMNMNSTFINESGLYSAILGSNKPEAKRFKKWITSEVLPAIRKTGRFEVDHEARKKSAKTRSLLTAHWKAHGADKPHHYINLTRAEYKALGYGSGVGVHKDEMTEEERARLMVFESIETYKLMRNPQIEGYHQLADSVAETGRHIPMLIDDIIARRVLA